MIAPEKLSQNARKIDIPVKELIYPKVNRKRVYDSMLVQGID